MIGLPSVECLLNTLAQLHVIDEVQDVYRPTNVVQFPKGLLGLVLPGVAAEFSHNGGLGGVLLGERRHDALHVGPFVDVNSSLTLLLGLISMSAGYLLGYSKPTRDAVFLCNLLYRGANP